MWMVGVDIAFRFGSARDSMRLQIDCHFSLSFCLSPYPSSMDGHRHQLIAPSAATGAVFF
jgi:hypothetical protein